MKKQIVIGGLALLLVAGCQSKEVTVEQEVPIERAVKEVTASSYEKYDEQYKKTLKQIDALKSQVDEQKLYEMKIHYEKRVAMWKRYMNKLLDELHQTKDEQAWQTIQQQQTIWYEDMEKKANEAAAKQERSEQLVTYLKEKEAAMQMRARYVLDNYYFNSTSNK